MNHLDKTIIQSIALYPSLNKSRMSVLEHLFCTIDNGYEWIRGRLEYYEIPGTPSSVVNLDGTDEEFIESLKIAVEMQNVERARSYEKNQNSQVRALLQETSRLSQEISDRFAEMEREHYEEFYAPIVFDMEKFLRISKSYDFKAENVYPISRDYSAIFTIPEDAEPCYVLGAMETISIVLMLDSENPDALWHPLGTRTNRQHVESNKEKAREAMERINRLWGTRG